jgi:site-specific DNA-cytosine methylase
MNILSLFDGLSAAQIALNRANISYDNYFASEIDKFAIKVTQHYYPNTIQLGNVLDITFTSLPKIDLLLGGSPCQGFSNSGKCYNFEDPRSKLFFEYVRALKESKPKYFLYENVKVKNTVKDIISKFLEVQPIEINSNLVSAQNRKRYYWTNIPNVRQPKDKGILLQDILETDNNVLGQYKANKLPFLCKLFNDPKKQYLNCTNRLKSNTVTTHYCSRDGVGYLEYEDWLRYFTPLECERLQTLPDNYTNVVNTSKTQRYKMIGNAWTVDVIKHLLKNIK